MIKHEFPILDHDSNTNELFKPRICTELPEKAVFGLLGDCIDSYARDFGGRVAEVFPTITKDYPIYIIEHNGEEICLFQAPMGAPAAVQNFEILLNCGVKHIISAGSCGVLREMPENRFMVPVRALRDEGCSYHYLPPSRFVELDMPMTEHICRCLGEMSIPYERCTTWTTDAFFRETPDMVEYRRSEGCTAVDMECSALAACAKLRGADFGMLFFTADTLADMDNYDRRDFGEASRAPALRLCLDIITRKMS
ncbi:MULTISPECIES: nucleoside phosphorylase [Ruminococcus]|uniref:Uridine phosphorylase n=1 Tax=Ruminococcus flavefaciens TaxID=1265 RepID=A0A315Y264_RUMFL|nr:MULTISPECIES: nucleoside phosphorylase [Ruminococcus]MBR1430652.1 nucleoside phosphorylase [Ruminococcus sp.]PWJ14582.1 uridine phosphorylase [Ruminococcus flavefaciens]SSA42612.1 Uridine phosphorylase [Ruminococcus flavefaciens]